MKKMMNRQEMEMMEQACRELYETHEEIALLKLLRKTERHIKEQEIIYPEEVDVAMVKRNSCLRMDRIDW
jgi:hypothetical protein